MEITKKSQFVVLPHDTDPVQEKYAAWQTLRDNGMTLKQIGKLFGVSDATVCNHTECHCDWRINAGSFAHKAKLERQEYYIPLMLELRKMGYSNTDIAVKTGFSDWTVRQYVGNQPDEITLASLRAAGAKRRFRNLAKKNQPARDNGEPIPAVAKALGKSA